jgi:NCAIR mutase (PurE)-related protein
MAWNVRPFDSMRGALNAAGDDESESVRIDPGRAARTGAPEIVFASSKSTDDVERALARLAQANGRAIATRCRDEHLVEIPVRFADLFDVTVHHVARTVVVSQPGAPPRRARGRVGILTAGTSDVPVASEASVIARELRCEVLEARDVGVAGIHRLVQPLERLAEWGAHVVIVAAGMDGALPSVVAGLVPVPVIGLPTSVGYGFGGDGTGALMTMLQSCAPGLVVVNIDNGVGAGVAAAKIAQLANPDRDEGSTRS